MATRLYLPDFFCAEHELAALLRTFLRRHSADQLEWTKYCDGLGGDQKLAMEMIAGNQLGLLYGVPGSGKTTTMIRAIQMLDGSGLTGAIAAPTGKAAKRADEVLTASGKAFESRPECKTTYRLLEYSPRENKFLYNEKNKLPLDYLFIDESSFLGQLHARDLFLAIDPQQTRVILVGDPYQLPSVEPGCVFRDMIESRKFASVGLNEVWRQGADSGIVHNANRILRGLMPEAMDPKTGERFTDWFFLEELNEQSALTKIVDYVATKVPAKLNIDPINDIQTLSPGKKSLVGTVSLNKALRDALNPGKAGEQEFRGLRLKDKVINKKTNYNHGIYNGDVGKIVEVGKHGMTIDFGPGSGLDGKGIVTLEGEAADPVYLNFAGTVHGAQGSEYPVQVTPLYRTHYRLLSRNLLYTVDTRAKKCSIQIGDPDALRRCVDHSETVIRNTGLQEWLSRG